MQAIVLSWGRGLLGEISAASKSKELRAITAESLQSSIHAFSGYASGSPCDFLGDEHEMTASGNHH